MIEPAKLETATSERANAETATSDRRRNRRVDRRRHSRSGRRAADPRSDQRWRRLAWLFGAYAVYLSVRQFPTALRRFWKRGTLA